MRRSWFFVLGAVGVLLSSAALAQPAPNPALCIVPCGFNLVGMSGGVAAVQGQFTVTVNSAPFTPVPFSTVVINFDPCIPDIRVCSAQPFAGVVASECPGLPVGQITSVATALGVATFRIVGGANNAPGTPAAGFQCAQVLANNGAGGPFVNLGNVNVGAFDENGAGGVNPADISVWLSDVFDADYEGRSDFNCSNSVNPADLAILLGVSLSGSSTSSCAIYC